MALSRYSSGFWSRAGSLSFRQWDALRTAIWLLAKARLEHYRKPIKTVLQRFQKTDNRRWATTGETELIGWAIASAAARVPWRSDCLLQAMAASMWLDRVGRSYKLNIGVRKNDAGELEAHAWLTSGNLTVTGGLPDLEGFSTIPLESGILKL